MPLRSEVRLLGEWWWISVGDAFIFLQVRGGAWIGWTGKNSQISTFFPKNSPSDRPPFESLWPF